MLEPLTEAKIAQPAMLVCSSPPGSRRDQLREPAVDAVAQAADAQDFGHQHEQRHGGEREAVHAAPAHQAEAVERRQARPAAAGRCTAGTAIANGTAIPAVSRPRNNSGDDEDLELRTDIAPAARGSAAPLRLGEQASGTSEKHSAAMPITIASRGIQSGVSR